MRVLLPLPIVLPAAGGGAVHPRRRVAHGPADHRARHAERARADLAGHPPARRRRRRGRRPGRRLAGARRHQPRRRPAVGDHAADGVDRAALRARLRHRPARRRAQPRRLPVGVHDPRRRRVGGLPDRRPVQPVRRRRDDAHGQLRADHARRTAGAGALGHDVRRHQPRRVGAVPDRPGLHVRRHGHRQHGRPGRAHRRAAERRAGRAGRAAVRRLRHQGGAVPAVLLAARQLPDARRRPSPPSSPGC